jgi:AcrR family transcriptional regulator
MSSNASFAKYTEIPSALWYPYTELSFAFKRQMEGASDFFEASTVRRKDMARQPAETARKLRVDAVRNRERVLEAAKTVFSTGGGEASLEAVAKRAGVGIGTLYRHFPTREALFEAVYRREVEQLAQLAEELKSDASPIEALRRWLRANIEFAATKKGMSTALALAAHASPNLRAYTFDRLTKAVGALLERAIAMGELRPDVGPEDLLRTLVGMYYMHDQPGWQDRVARLMDIFIDGLRVRTTASPSGQAEGRSHRRVSRNRVHAGRSH